MGDRIFRALLKLLPAEFRGEYEREMEHTFRAERAEASTGGALLRVWASTVADVFRTAPAEHADILKRDLHYAVRMLGRRPALTLTAVLTLALGIGTNTAIFSVVHRVIFAPLPYAAPDRLVMVQEDDADDEPGTTGYASFDRVRAEQQTLDWMAATAGWSVTLTEPGRDAERLVGARVSWEFFRTLGVTPALGRDFEQQDDHRDRRRQVILSDQVWRQQFNADRSVIGRAVTINGAPYVVIGVLPASVRELVTDRLFPGTAIWTLLGYSPELPQACRTCRHIHVVGRLRQGVDIRQAQADLTRVYQTLAAEYPKDYARPTAALTPVRRFFLGPIEQPLLMLWVAVGVLLLMTCANIAGLLLIRASERDEEIAIRRALGVSPVRLLRQLLTESLVLALMGGVAGAVLAWWGTGIIAANGPEEIPRIGEVTVDSRVLLYALATTLLTGVIFGIVPARLLLRRSLSPSRARFGGATTVTWNHRAGLIAVNVALSALLLVGSGLLVRSFVRLLAVDPGFDPQRTLTFQLDLSGDRYAKGPAVTAFYDALTTRLLSLPGVDVVGASTQLPLTDNRDRWGVRIEGRPLENPADAPEADRYGVTPGYFAAMRIPLLRGRLFTDADGEGAPPVVVVGKTLADELWPGEDPIGQRVTLAGGPNNPPRTIVGIVGDVRHYGLHMPPTIQVYMPRAQSPWLETSMTLVVRMNEGVDPLSIAGAARDHVRALDALQPIMDMRTYEAIVAESVATRRFTLFLLAVFAGSAMLLAVVGLYGAVSFVVGQRQRELGVRIALGAGRGEIRRLVLWQGMRPVIAGAIVGLVASVGGARALQTMLFRVAPNDFVTFAFVMVTIVGGALVACVIPAVRATRIDPAITLRAE